jgi:predicted amidohydrolase
MPSRLRLLLMVLLLGCSANVGASFGEDEWEGWASNSPRDEIRPAFRADPKSHALVIETDEREGLQGWWSKELPVNGGEYYSFSVDRVVSDFDNSRRCAFPRIIWKDDQHNVVNRDTSVVGPYHPAGTPAQSTPEYPREGDSVIGVGRDGPATFQRYTGTYRAPKAATRAIIELHLQWAPGGRVEWSDVSLTSSPEIPRRIVRLATVHYRPRKGETTDEKRQQFAPLIEEAARQKADLVVLPETLTYYGMGKKPDEVAEPVPGPSTEYFGRLAKQYDLYVVAGIYEREGHLIYNTAILLGPDGSLVGKYHKVTLPRNEVALGVAAGDEYPIFDTRFGKLGMMICYDGFFPEVARQLTNRGAEVIAWPVWGCNPALAAARACENHVYLVSSTYEDVSRNWMLTAVWDHDGQTIARAEKWGTVVVTEVDLNQRLHWPSLGDFKADLARHRPEWESEESRR